MNTLNKMKRIVGLTFLSLGAVGFVHASGIQHATSKGNSTATRKPSSSSVDLIRTYCEKTDSLNTLITSVSGHHSFCIEEVKCTWADPAFIKTVGGVSKLPVDENSPRVQHGVVDSVYCTANSDGTCPTIKECISDKSVTAQVMLAPSGQIWHADK